MKIHPDGTLEGTAEELAAYQSKVEANKMPNLWGHKPTPWEKHRSIGVQIGGIGTAGQGGCNYTKPRDHYPTIMRNTF
ncbi:hypothetical protein [Paenibacillus kandeliae]|uniref:hypothetical protein n=1 Tax=Paenibacillus kandeliae TaxID=3231269 RepID=UPI00345AE744